jgi:uncharacterized Zn-binding protein involved in type VI secretion
MPGIARASGTDSVASPHGTGRNCTSPTTQATAAGSGDIIVNNKGAVREGDAMTTHNQPGCTPHAPGLSSFSSTVYANGKRVGRLGDVYGGEHKITSGSADIIVG